MWMHKWTDIAMQQNYDGYQASLSIQTIQGNILIYIHSFYNNYKIYSYNYTSHDELILFYVNVFNVTIQINLTLSLLHIGVMCFYASYVIATFCIIKCCNMILKDAEYMVKKLIKIRLLSEFCHTIFIAKYSCLNCYINLYRYFDYKYSNVCIVWSKFE